MPVATVPDQLVPHWSTTDQTTVRLYCGQALDVLRQMPDCSVHCAITSPPYYQLRSYGLDQSLEIGRESTLQEYVDRLTRVCREIRRVLRDDGCFFMNLGDSYGQGGQLQGMPWRVALSLQSDGWVLRQDIIWKKPAPMPESVRDRCTKSHEYVFLLTKCSPGYYYDAEAIKEPHATAGDSCNREDYQPIRAVGLGDDEVNDGRTRSMGPTTWPASGRNKRSVWTVANHGYKGAHFSTFPPALIEPMVKAGTSEKGCCPSCGSPWVRQLKRDRKPTRPGVDTKVNGHTPEQFGNRDPLRHCTTVETVGWAPSCQCARYRCTTCCLVIECTSKGGARNVIKDAVGSLMLQVQEVVFTENRDPEALRPVMRQVGDSGKEERTTTSPVEKQAKAVQTLSEGVQAEISPRRVLRQKLRGQMEKESKPNRERMVSDHERLHPDISPESPQRIEDGVRDATPSGDGERTRKTPAKGRGGSPQERHQERQPTGEPGADDQTRPRPETEATPPEDHFVSVLWQQAPSIERCPHCGGDCKPEPLDPIPSVILDPFVGSGTTCAVAVRLGRRGWGIDLSQEYIEKHAIIRVKDALRQVGQERLIPIRPVKPLR